MDKIPWLDVHIMMVDAPYFESNDDFDKKNKGSRTEYNAESFAPKTDEGKLMSFLNSFNDE